MTGPGVYRQQVSKPVSIQTNTWQARSGLDRKWVMGRFGFAVALLILEAILIVAVALLTGVAYHLEVYGEPGEIANYAAVGVAMSLLFTLPIDRKSVV